MAGLATTRAVGQTAGRRPKSTPAKLAAAREMYEEGEHTVVEIAAIAGVARSTLYRSLDPAGAE